MIWRLFAIALVVAVLASGYIAGTGLAEALRTVGL